MSRKISLKQFLLKTGKFERADDCINTIRSGKAKVNGKVIINPSYFFNPEKSLVKLNNEKVKAIKKLYFILSKPAGYLSQKAGNEKTIYELIDRLDIPEEHKKSLFAAGRLDKDTEGLMIITNDGRLSDKMMQPGSEITKKYYAVLENPVDKNKAKMLGKGIEINLEHEKYRTKPCKIKVTGEKEVYITISEGKKRQIRKMFEAIGNKVAYLKRVSIGGMQLGDLKAGEFRQLTREEILEKLEY